MANTFTLVTTGDFISALQIPWLLLSCKEFAVVDECGKDNSLRQQNCLTTTPYWVTELVSANAYALSPAERVLVFGSTKSHECDNKQATKKKDFVTLISDPKHCQLYE